VGGGLNWTDYFLLKLFIHVTHFDLIHTRFWIRQQALALFGVLHCNIEESFGTDSSALPNFMAQQMKQKAKWRTNKSCRSMSFHGDCGLLLRPDSFLSICIKKGLPLRPNSFLSRYIGKKAQCAYTWFIISSKADL